MFAFAGEKEYHILLKNIRNLAKLPPLPFCYHNILCMLQFQSSGWKQLA